MTSSPGRPGDVRRIGRGPLPTLERIPSRSGSPGGDPVRLPDGRDGVVLSCWLDLARGTDTSVDLLDGGPLVRVASADLKRRAS